MNPRTNNRRLYQLLGVVFLLAMGYQIWFSITGIQYRHRYNTEVAWPFDIEVDSDRISSGIQAGDQLLEIEGRPYEGLAQLVNVLADRRPGDKPTIKGLENG